jgi:TRAP-type uncharacterized transport system substrate-binding protein
MSEAPKFAPMSRLEAEIGLSWRALIAIALPLLALLAASLWLAAQFLHPMLPTRVVFAAGPADGALYAFAMRYRSQLAQQGITLDVMATRGVEDNLALLRGGQGGADAGFLVAGMASTADASELSNLGNVAYAPLWVIYRGGHEVTDLTGFRGRRIAVGERGSGLAAVMGPILAANGLSPSTSRFVELSFDQALTALFAGEVDVALLGEGPRRREFVEALARPDLRLMDFARADAYARRFPWLHALRLPAGTLDFERDLPPRDTRLIGTTILIAARGSLHPAIVDLLVDATRAVHGGNGFFEARGEFPDLHGVDALPISAQAIRYAQSGPTILRRYLPLWLADFLQRCFALAMPFLLIGLPAARWIPSGIDAMFGKRIQALYVELRMVERMVESKHADAAALASDLDRLEAHASAMRVPAKFASQLFVLRSHIQLVRQRATDRHAAR